MNLSPPVPVHGYYSRLSASKYAWLSIWEGKAHAHLSENKGAKSECKKFGEHSRKTASVSTICDEYCRNRDIPIVDIAIS